MENLNYEIHRLKQNMSNLSGRLQELHNENNTLKVKLVKALDEAEVLRKKNDELANNNVNLQLTRSSGFGQIENTELKQQLDELIREVDECITQLIGQHEDAV